MVECHTVRVGVEEAIYKRVYGGGRSGGGCMRRGGESRVPGDARKVYIEEACLSLRATFFFFFPVGGCNDLAVYWSLRRQGKRGSERYILSNRSFVLFFLVVYCRFLVLILFLLMLLLLLLSFSFWSVSQPERA